MELIHGGDWAGYVSEYGKMPMDFSQNVSPLGMPEGIRLAAAAAITEADRYPDPLCRELCAALSEYHSVPSEWILCGNGAADLIWRFMSAKKQANVLLTTPGFHEYEAAALAEGCTVDYYILKAENNFAICEDVLAAITPKTDILVLVQPGNPTGQLAEPELLMKILRRCRDCGTILAVDECFLEFLEDRERRTLIPELKNGGLLIFRAFTKIYAMAGLRLGYCLCSDTELLTDMRNAGQPWPVSNIAQAAGVAALREEEYCARLRKMVHTQRPLLENALSGMGFRVIPGQGNFILFYSENTTLRKELKDRGILIRDCSTFKGLSSGWYRIAVRTPEENEKLIAALREVTALWQNV